jgi:hypothetical protein
VNREELGGLHERLLRQSSVDAVVLFEHEVLLETVEGVGRDDQRGPLLRTAAGPTAPEARVLSISGGGAEVGRYVRQPVAWRPPTGCRREFLDAYRPNDSLSLPAAAPAHLATMGRAAIAAQPAKSG